MPSNEICCDPWTRLIVTVGLGWFDSLQDCAKEFVHFGREYQPIPENVAKYQALYDTYHQVYKQTKSLSHQLLAFRRN